MSDRIILGIDPGTNIMGYGLVHITGKEMKLLDLGLLHLDRLENHPLKLKKIFETAIGLIENHKPDELAIEAPFYGKNIQSMLKLGRAQGVAIAAALHKNIPIAEYSPKKIKQSLTGNGNASKEQVAGMLKTLLKFTETPKHLDATDALAAAVCHYFQTSRKASMENRKNYSGWKQFLAENPGRKK
jgi:crossover junction endodeoxyribonuclease RuvC